MKARSEKQQQEVARNGAIAERRNEECTRTIESATRQTIPRRGTTMETTGATVKHQSSNRSNKCDNGATRATWRRSRSERFAITALLAAAQEEQLQDTTKKKNRRARQQRSGRSHGEDRANDEDGEADEGKAPTSEEQRSKHARGTPFAEQLKAVAALNAEVFQDAEDECTASISRSQSPINGPRSHRPTDDPEMQSD